MHFDKLFPMRYFLVFVKQRILRFSKFFLKHKFTGHKNLACDNNIQEIELPMKNLWMLVDIGIQFSNLFFNFVHQ